jgi:hypothetical protein
MTTDNVVAFPRGQKKRELEYIISEYKKAHPKLDSDTVVPHDVAEWAIKRGLYRRPPVDPEEFLRRNISKHLHDEYVTDPQGREVRKNHPISIEVVTPKGPKRIWVWKELFHAPAPHMKASFQLRRRAALRDVQQLDLDFHSYNENNVFKESLPPMDYDFNKDMEELNLPTTYPINGPLDDEDDDQD